MNDTKEILRAIELQRNGRMIEAARKFERLGSKNRDPREKEQLWKQSRQCRELWEIYNR